MLCVIGVNFFWRYSMIFLLLVLTLNTFSTLFIPFIHNLLFFTPNFEHVLTLAEISSDVNYYLTTFLLF